jgi:uroporphyrin-III C-methyltransferase/precorrin-2 dehydrogenase/sirohydrochlorin ferrochelatase
MRDKAHKGTVFLVGAGPGDPDLLTLKAYRLIQTAQVGKYNVYNKITFAEGTSH